jgi:hypothetical protein
LGFLLILLFSELLKLAKSSLESLWITRIVLLHPGNITLRLLARLAKYRSNLLRMRGLLRSWSAEKLLAILEI